MRTKFPRAYKIYQEIIGEIYYEVLGLGFLARAVSRRRLRRLDAVLSDPIETAMTFRGIGLYRSIRPFQVRSEIATLFETVRDNKPRVIGEIGSDMGGTLYLWSRILSEDGTILSVDLPRLYRKSLNRFFTSFLPNRRRSSLCGRIHIPPAVLKGSENFLQGAPSIFCLLTETMAMRG